MINNLTRIILIQLFFIALAILFWTEDSSQHARFYILYGGLISGFQFCLLYFVWWRVFTKKKIAPSVIAVVIKYALLGLALWNLQPLSWNEIAALTIGIVTNPLAIVLFALTKTRT